MIHHERRMGVGNAVGMRMANWPAWVASAATGIGLPSGVTKILELVATAVVSIKISVKPAGISALPIDAEFTSGVSPSTPEVGEIFILAAVTLPAVVMLPWSSMVVTPFWKDRR